MLLADLRELAEGLSASAASSDAAATLRSTPARANTACLCLDVVRSVQPRELIR